MELERFINLSLLHPINIMIIWLTLAFAGVGLAVLTKHQRTSDA